MGNKIVQTGMEEGAAKGGEIAGEALGQSGKKAAEEVAGKLGAKGVLAWGSDEGFQAAAGWTTGGRSGETGRGCTCRLTCIRHNGIPSR